MDEKDLEVQNYESNLKMHYEAKRKELDILLTSSIPQQLSNMKTILWINFLMIGLMLQFIKKFPLPEINIGFFILLILAIISVILAMLTNRTKSYGVPNDILQMSKYNDNVWTVSQATLDMLGNLQESIKENRKVIVNRAKLMHMSTWFTLCSIFFIVISFSIMQISYKGGITMANDKGSKPVKLEIKPAPGRIIENSKPLPKAPKPPKHTTDK